MIPSRTIQHNSDRMYDISFILLSHNEENDQKRDLETSNAETEFKIGIYAKNWAKQVLLKIFDYSQQSELTINGQNQRLTDDMCWRGSVTSPYGLRGRTRSTAGAWSTWARGRAWTDTWGAWGSWWILTARGGMWSMCSWGKNFSRRMWCSFWPFLVGFCSGLAVLSFYAFSLAVDIRELQVL